MKHNLKITALLLAMFLFTQLLGLAVINAYSPRIEKVFVNGTVQNVTVQTEIPYGMQPPEMQPWEALQSIGVSIILAVIIMFFLMKKRADLLLRVWLFSVVVISIAIAFNAGFMKLSFLSGTQMLAFVLAFPLAFYKIFQRNIIIHNATELLIYPGIAVIFVPILNVWAAAALLALIAVYDVYAVWHSGFMQKLAKFQMNQLKVFTGFFVPYVAKKDRIIIERMKSLPQKEKMQKFKKLKIKVNLAILGGGDITFPLIFAGVILRTSGLLHAIIVPLAATLALLLLFAVAKKGKFYPAMLFLSPACILAWLIGMLF
ncbi:MAG: presenilin family intramembrane aspartyl protease [archaeon]